MSLRDRTKLLFPTLCFLLIVPGLSAQEVSYEDQLNLIAPTYTGETGLFKTITGDTLGDGEWSFSIYYNNFDYLAAPPAPDMVIPSRRSFRLMDIDEDRLSLSFGYGLTDRWEFSAAIPWVRLDQNAGDLSGFVNGFPYMGSFKDSGIGNIHLATKIGLLDPDAYASRFALSLFADLPTGDEDSGISSGNADYGLGLHWNYRMFALSGIYKNTGDRDAADNPRGGSIDLPNEIQLDAGLSIPLRFWPTTNWINEINAVFYSGGDSGMEPDEPIYLVSGIRHWFGTSGWALNAAVRANATMWNDNDACAIGGLLGLTYAPMRLTPLAPAPSAPVPPPPPRAPVAPPPAPVTPAPQPQEIRTDEIHFESGSARLTNIAKAILDDVALRMRQEPASTAIVIGYTDNRENTGAGADLDRRRAEAVRDYLVSRHGIDPSRISVEARGTQDTVGDNSTAEGRLRNRRVVIRLIIP
ncbi:MAG TPA: OmpA family protein [Thermoanaerobaculia bacterium]|nr:OmpA family protein [Thermoanaerobaculia bacterium]